MSPAVEDVTDRKRIEEELSRYREGLEEMVAERTRALEQANERLRREVEERRQMEVRLRQTQYAVDHAATAIFWLNIRTARVIYANRQALDDLRCGREEILGRRVWDLGPDFSERRWPAFRRIMRRRGVMRFEARLSHQEGHLLPVDITVCRTEFEGEERLVAFVNDITRQRAVLEALRESEARFRQIAETIDEVFWLVDWRRDRGIYISPAFETLWQQDPALFYEDWHVGARSIHPQDAPKAAQAFQQAIATHSGYEAEYRIVRPDGSIRWIHDRGFLILDEAREVSRIAGLSENITERKTFELALEQARDEAEAANRAKNAFLSTMSHELRTPLNAIIGFARLLAGEEGLSREHRQNLVTIDRSGHHLLALINEVLEISRIEAGRVFLEEDPFDLADTLRTMEEMMRERARHKGLQLRVAREGPLPRYVRGDGSRLRQVLVNLLGNAVKFTERGSVELRVEAVERGIHFAVSDTGPGLGAEDRDHIFEAFYQSPASAAMGEGTGLGLAISREFVRLMGGDITVHSEPGIGTTFEFTIQLPDAPEVSVPGHSRGRVVALAPGQGVPRVLVVEDEPENRRMLVALLERGGFEVSSAGDGTAAVRAFQRIRPHFIWMDMGLPDVDGYEATRRIRVLPGGMDVVIAAQTAAAFSEDRRKILRAGCQEVLVKPLDADEVFEVMGRYLGIEYDYGPEPVAADGPAAPPLPELRGWDAGRVDALRRAALALDARAVRDLLAEVEDSPVAEGLRVLVDDFRFEEIIRLCEEHREARGVAPANQD
ncbi:MAG: ATP-binding protein [Gammaproteobacteria bacterium]|nr:ATP-binding protein [Gammaproteobacteria bacterium]